MWIGYLASVSLSATFLMLCGIILQNWKITKRASNVLLNRSIYCRYHWTHHTLRALLELGAWLAVMCTIFSNSLATNGMMFNLLRCSIYGTISGIIVCLTAEWLVPIVATHAKIKSSKTPSSEESKTNVNIAMNAYMLFSVLILALMLIFKYCKYICFAVSMSTIASIVMILAGDFFSHLKTSKIAGNILQDRIQRPLYNWRFHFWRSAFEFTCWQSAIYMSYYTHGNIISSLQTGCFVGCFVVLFCDSCLRKDESVKDFGDVTPQIVSKLQEILRKKLTPDVKPKLKRTHHVRKMGVYTMEEVAKHNTFEDCWIVYQDNVMDCSGWLRHPGGRILLERFAGCDATDEIRMYHFDWVINDKLPMRCIGIVTDPPQPTETQKDFRQLYKYFVEEGYFEPRLKDYVIKAMFLTPLFVSIWMMVIYSNSNWIHLLAAIFLAIFWQQVAFIGHDVGHNSVFCNLKADEKLGLLVGNFLTGICIDWWKATHNVHHAVPNSLYDDPDIAHLPMFAVSPEFFKNLYNTYHHRIMEFDFAARNIFIPFQHYLYYPIMMVARFNLYAQSVIRLLKEPFIRNRSHELIAEAGFYAWYFLLISQLNSAGMMLAFTLLSHACAGMLNVQITLSHFSMPVNEGKKVGYGGDFYTRNIEASMDISCSTMMDWFHGGLQFQTLHHVYPRMPRGYVRKSQPFIVALCKKHGIRYKAENFIDANLEVYNHLRETAVKTSTWSPRIWESANLEG